MPAGEVGEIFTRFAELPDFTYHNRPDERAKVDREGFITSGDVGYLDADGYLFLCDRKRDMVISGGVNIYPAEIEAVLHAMPGVKDCAVFGIPDAEFGEKLMAVVEPADGATLTADERARLSARPSRRLQGAQGHRDRPRPAARGQRQDLQAPAARPVLAEAPGGGFSYRCHPGACLPRIELAAVTGSRRERLRRPANGWLPGTSLG